MMVFSDGVDYLKARRDARVSSARGAFYVTGLSLALALEHRLLRERKTLVTMLGFLIKKKESVLQSLCIWLSALTL
jgi:hypothetical protein